MEQAEGVIKYRLDFRAAPPLADGTLADLIAWQQIMHRLGLLGRDAARYGGLAYGNLSRRRGGGFVISASQCGDRAEPGGGDYSLVTGWDCAANRIVAEGPAAPSSESLTHAALYDADPAVVAIIHVHSAEIWQQRDQLGLASTDATVSYGTPAMADEVGRLYKTARFDGFGLLAMAGHQDGIVAFGRSLDEAGAAVVTLLARARQLRV